MKLSVYTVFDTKAKAYLNPFYSTNDETAKRQILECVLDPQHRFCMHATDYVLFKLGDFENTECKFELLQAPEHMVNLITMKQASEESISAIAEDGAPLREIA